MSFGGKIIFQILELNSNLIKITIESVINSGADFHQIPFKLNRNDRADNIHIIFEPIGIPFDLKGKEIHFTE